MVNQDHPSGAPRQELSRANALPLALTLLLLAGSTAAMGCGETTSTPAKTGQAAANSTQTAPVPAGTSAAANASTPAGSTSGSAATDGPAHGPGAGRALRSSTGGSGGAHAARSRAHLVLPPAGARPAPGLSASDRAKLPVTDITLSSPAITQHKGAPAVIGGRYTCHGQNSSPPMHWSSVPAGTKELALFAMNTTPVAGKLFFDWAVAGINPTLTGLPAGQLPAGAVTGRNSYGHTNYNLCPPTAGKESYVFMIFALPATLSPKPGFDPTTLRTQALQTSHHSGLLAGTNG